MIGYTMGVILGLFFALIFVLSFGSVLPSVDTKCPEHNPAYFMHGGADLARANPCDPPRR